MRFKDKILIKIIDFHYDIQNFILNFLKNLLFDNRNILESKRILIFRTGSLGDSVCALPAIYSIRENFPNAEIDILTNAGSPDLVSINQIVDKNLVNNIYDYYGEPKRKIINKLKLKQYDLFIELPQYVTTFWRELKFIFFAKILGIKNAFGWQVASTRFLAKYQDRLKIFINERDRLLTILERKGLNNFGLQFPFDCIPEMKKKVLNILRENNLTNKEKNIAFVVGAKREQNRWPIKYFKEVAEDVIKKGYNILGVGVKEDYDLFKEMGIAKNIHNFCGVLLPLETVELLGNCKLTITNDTGPMHLSYAIGTPVFAIFSIRDYPNKWYPPEDNNIVFQSKFWDLNENSRMNNLQDLCDITPQKVLSKIYSTVLSG